MMTRLRRSLSFLVLRKLYSVERQLFGAGQHLVSIMMAQLYITHRLDVNNASTDAETHVTRSS